MITVLLTIGLIVCAIAAAIYRDNAAEARADAAAANEWSNGWYRLSQQCTEQIAKRDAEIRKLVEQISAIATRHCESNGNIRHYVANGICDMLLYWIQIPCAFRDWQLDRMLGIMKMVAPEEVIQPWVERIRQQVGEQDTDGARQSAKAMARLCRLPAPVEAAPWKLGQTVNGHRLPPGAEWHRSDFTGDMLPADPPFRPLMLNEPCIPADEFQDTDGKFKLRKIGNEGTLPKMARQRTTRPIPAQPAPVKRGEHLFDAVAAARPCGGRESEPDNTVRVSLERRG